jgi:hypothetical protein
MQVFWFSMFWTWILVLLQMNQSFGCNVMYHSRYFYVIFCECGDNNSYRCQHKNAQQTHTQIGVPWAIIFAHAPF